VQVDSLLAGASKTRDPSDWEVGGQVLAGGSGDGSMELRRPWKPRVAWVRSCSGVQPESNRFATARWVRAESN